MKRGGASTNQVMKWLVVFLTIYSGLCWMLSAALGQDIDLNPQTRLMPIQTIQSQDTFGRVVEQTKQSLCVVRSPLPKGEFAVGSGCYIGNGWVLSARHVVKGQYATCSFSTDQIEASIVLTSASCDSALIKLTRQPNVPAVQIADDLLPGQIYLAGFDKGSRLRYFNAIPHPNVHRNMQGQLVIFAKSRPQQGGIPGQSGGPAFDSQARLIGNVESSNWHGPRDSTVVTHPRTLRAFFQRCEQRYPQYGFSCPPGMSCPTPQPVPVQPQPQPSQPLPVCPPQKCEVDYEKLIEMIAGDQRFRGEDGEDGADGENGDDGEDGADGASAEVDYKQVRQLIQEELAKLPPIGLQPSYYGPDGNLRPEGSPIELRLGEITPLPPVAVEVNGASGRKSYSQGALGGTMRIKGVDFQ